MISISSFFLVSYLMMAGCYTFEAAINKDKLNKYWYMLPFVVCWCLLMCWFYFPCEVGFKLYKKLNDTNDKKN
jgi:hypothetical protein